VLSATALLAGLAWLWGCSSPASSPGDAGDGAPASPNADAGRDAPDGATDPPDEGDELTSVSGWSVRKRVRSATAADLLLEEVPISFTVTLTGPSRVRVPAAAGNPERTWSAPEGMYISDACRHPSGQVSAVLLGADRAVFLARFAADLTPVVITQLHDPAVASDPHASGAGPDDLRANGFAPDGARIAAAGEDVVAVVDTAANSIVAYRASFAGAWSTPQRTLLEPPAGLTPFLPTSGTFDTFGAIVAWFRSPLDVDEQGNAYVAVWANPTRLQAHVDAFHDGLVPLASDAGAVFASADVVLTKMSAGGARLWSAVVGTAREDEPYAIRANGGSVAVVGRSRRFPGIDNTAWDAFVAVVSVDGVPVVARTLPLDASGILLAVDRGPHGGWVLGGSDGWSQNPEGLSVTSYGAKLLLLLPAPEAAPVRIPLPAGPRNNEIRTVVGSATRLWFGGDEDGPIMHTADGDLSQIHASGVLGSVRLPQP
jgi:hypothetical protein